jgi:GrpB protein
VAAIAAQPSPVGRRPMVVAIVALGALRSDKYFVNSRVVDSDYIPPLGLRLELSVEVDRMLVFRDWLRTNAADRELYARTKRELATRNWKYMQQYADAKTAVVKEIMARAEATAP